MRKKRRATPEAVNLVGEGGRTDGKGKIIVAGAAYATEGISPVS